MAMKKILLDTNAYSALLTGDKKVLEKLGEADLVLISIFVLGELFYGFKGGTKEKENKKILSDFLKKLKTEVVNATAQTAEIFGNLKNNLKRKGNPLPINDVWIAAHCLEYGAQLITYDRHFETIENLLVWDHTG